MATVDKPQTEMVTLEIDGQSVEAPRGSMIIEAADRIGIDIPRFCYHRKLSIAANCRMCLVDVEKAPKPLPACATPVADGMKVFTESRRAVDAQRNVMEFLLINHPLDCPICDQGGECELQDLAMGYGRSVSRFVERKRVVKDKNLGPLISTDMTRCIHCTRCIRFLEEIGGSTELGGMGRGEKLEISTFIERNINSELSGNVIDLCPVGALTNKPFRFSARPWEMRARPYIGTHDCLGSNLFYHVRGGRIMRTVPRDNEAINECWIADRDRYSHFGLEAGDRLTAPRLKIDGQWQTVDWDRALAATADAIRDTVEQHGPAALGALVSPRATSEEHFLLGRLWHGLGSSHIDHRLRLTDFSHPQAGQARMDRPSRELAAADALFLVGSNIRHEVPILGHRVRTAWRIGGAIVMDLNPVAYPFHFDLTQRLIVPPQAMADSLARVCRAAIELTGCQQPDGQLGKFISAREADQVTRDIAASLRDANSAVILLGEVALNHPHAGLMRRLAEWLADVLEVALCVLPGPANSVGAWQAGCVPGAQGLDARAMLEQPLKLYWLHDIEPGLDLADPAAARAALGQADKVIAVSAFADAELKELADILLPLAAVPATDGSYVNLDGARQLLTEGVRPVGQSRAGWKILRRLGEMLGIEGFDFVGLADVGNQMASFEFDRPQTDGESQLPATVDGNELWRIGDVPMFATDNLVRRSPPLSQTAHARSTAARINPSTADRLGLSDAGRVRVVQGETSAEVDLTLDERIAPNALWLPAAHDAVRVLGSAHGPVEVESAS